MVLQPATTIALVSLSAWSAFGQTLSQEDRQRASELNAAIHREGPLTMAKVRGLTEEDKSFLRAYYRDVLDRDKDSVNEIPFRLELAMVGDQEARDRIVRKWVGSYWQFPHDLLALENPEAIAEIGELLFLNEVDQMPYDVGYIAPQKTSCMVIVDTLGKSPTFNYDVQQWARRVRNAKGGLDLVRAWYRENEALLKKGDFQAVQPGRLPVEVEAAQPLPVEPVVNVEPVPNVPAAPTVEATHELAPTSSEWSFAAIAIGCLVLLGGLVIFWKRRPS